MHGLQACLFKYITVAAFHIYAQHVKMPLKGEVGGHALYSHGNSLFIMEKSWNCVFEFLWEPCNLFYQSSQILTELFQHNLINVSYLTACYLYQVMMTLHFFERRY